MTKEDAILLAKHLKITELEQDIHLHGDIGDAEIIEMAEHLKEAKVSHIIDLSHNQIGDEGAKALSAMFLRTSNPFLLKGMIPKFNYALEAFHNSKKFLDTIADKIYGSNSAFKELPILGIGTKLHQKLSELVLQKIAEYVGIKWMAKYNLAAIREAGCAVNNHYDSIDYGTLASSKAMIDLGIGSKWHGENLARYFAVSDDLSYRDSLGNTELVRSIYKNVNIPDEIFQKAAAKFGSANLLEYIMAVNKDGQGAMSVQFQKFTNII